MTQAIRKLSFEEYASLDAEDWVRLGLPEGRCEYVDGELVEVPSESEPNDWIARYHLFLLLANAGVVAARLIAIHTCEIELAQSSSRSFLRLTFEVLGKPRTRYPDVVILRDEHLSLTQKRLFITLAMPAPQLVAEVVSLGDKNHQRDYEAKRKQYQERGIPEYWLLNPKTQTIKILELKDDQYTVFGTFQGSAPIQSPNLKGLKFTAEQVFAAGE